MMKPATAATCRGALRCAVTAAVENDLTPDDDDDDAEAREARDCRDPRRCAVTGAVTIFRRVKVVGEAGLGCTQTLSKNELSDAIKAGALSRQAETVEHSLASGDTKKSLRV